MRLFMVLQMQGAHLHQMQQHGRGLHQMHLDSLEKILLQGR